MMIPQLPFREENGRVVLTGPVLLTCGCGTVTARWATLQSQLVTRLPQGKPKASKIINNWIIQEDLKSKWPELKCHTYGLVVAQTDKGFEYVNIMGGSTAGVLERIGRLLERSKRV